ncbi:hypothetical protein F7206_04050 [Helicobacter pylori]|nr:hypothetical protein [Helicobacter pylori]
MKREHQLEKTSSYNKDQVQKIIEFLEQIDRALNQRKIRKTIGIITPYNTQKNACDQKWKNAASRILMRSK